MLNKQLILRAVGLDETASKRGHNYVTVFIDMDRRDKPVIFVVPGKGKACVAAFREFLLGQGGEPTRVAEAPSITGSRRLCREIRVS